MATIRNDFRQALGQLPPALAQTVETGDSFRFEALGLLDRAKARFNALEKIPAGDDAGVGIAALESMHLITKALLSARGFHSLSTASAIALLRAIYGKDIPEEILSRYQQVQSMKLQGAQARQALSAYISTASKLLTE